MEDPVKSQEFKILAGDFQSMHDDKLAGFDTLDDSYMLVFTHEF